jgi:hypothetical protein
VNVEGVGAGAVEGSPARCHAAAAVAASTIPAVDSRPSSHDARCDASVTDPDATAASRPPEWAWPPVGRRPSPRSRRAASAMVGQDVGQKRK